MFKNIKFYQKVKLLGCLKNVTSQGGLLLAGKIAVCAGFQDLVEKTVHFKKRLRGFTESQFLFTMILGFLSGTQNLEDFKLFQKDNTLRDVLGGFHFPSPSTLFKIFQKMNIGHIKQINKLQWKLYERLGKPLPKQVTLDVDASLIEVFGKKEGARYSYKRNLSFNPLLAFISETQEMVGCQLRSGNSTSHNKFIPFLKEILKKIGGKVNQLIIRLDGGFFTREILATIEQTKGVDYIVGAYKSAAVLNIILNIQQAKWQDYKNGRWCTEFRYKGKATKDNIVRRYVVMRKERPAHAQLDLFEGIYEYHVVVTSLDWKPQKILDHYFKRGQSEYFIKEYKNGVGMRHLPFKKFMANWSYLLIGQLAYNFSLWIKHWALPGTWGRFSLKTLRFRLFHQPVKLVNIKRRPIIQLSIHYPWIREIKSSWQKIDKLAA